MIPITPKCVPDDLPEEKPAKNSPPVNSCDEILFRPITPAQGWARSKSSQGTEKTDIWGADMLDWVENDSIPIRKFDGPNSLSCLVQDIHQKKSKKMFQFFLGWPIISVRALASN